MIKVKKQKATSNFKLKQFPDAINCSPESKYTQLPNELLRNPDLSSKAKTIISILSTNKTGWKSSLQSLCGFMKEKTDAIRSGLLELEEFGYLKRFRFRNKKTKQWVGSFWAYSHTPFVFNLQSYLENLDLNGLEVTDKEGKEIQSLKKPHAEKPHVALPNVVKPTLKILSNKKNINKPPYPLKSNSSNRKKLNGNIPPIKIFKQHLPTKVSKNKHLILTIREFILMRKEKKKPLTERSIKMICTKCKGFTTDEIIKAFEESVISQYTSIFPKSENNRVHCKSNKSTIKDNTSRNLSSFQEALFKDIERKTTISN